MRLFIAVLLMVTGMQASATGFEFRVADKTAEMFYLYKTSTFGYGGADVGWGYFFNENNDKMLSASVLVSGNGAGNNKALQFGVGMKAYLASIDASPSNLEAGGVGLGGLIRYVFSSATPVAILLEAYTVPQVTSVGDSDDLNEQRFAIELEVTPSAKAYIGYREITFGLEAGGEAVIDEETHFGVRVNF